MKDDKVGKDTTSKDNDLKINKFSEELERSKEEKLVNSIIEIIVSSTLKQYYEKSHPIPPVQPAGPE